MKLSNDLSVFDGQFQWYNKRVESADMFTAKSQSKLSTDFLLQTYQMSVTDERKKQKFKVSV